MTTKKRKLKARVPSRAAQGSPALTWLARPARAGWWWQAVLSDHEWFINPVQVQDVKSWDDMDEARRKSPEDFIGERPQWRWWAGPIESPKPPHEATPGNVEVSDSAQSGAVENVQRMKHEPNCNAYTGGGRCNCRQLQESRITPRPALSDAESVRCAAHGYTAFFRNERGNNQLKPEVVKALDVWGWRDKEQPDHRSNAEVWAFVSGCEAAMRFNGEVSDTAATGANKAAKP